MKINKIRFKNINSLRGEHEVDFTQEPLASAGLFAITGPTGSGKTTLLDVICLALFNRVPRINKAISTNLIAETGSILTRNTNEAHAEVEYHCAKGVFISKWEISTARTGRLRDYGMEIANAETQAPLSIKKSQVPSTNEAHIGLNYDQFVKSIMLAQGDFAKFLQANKGERSELLEKITGTSIYRRLGQKAYEMSKHLGQALIQLRDEQQVFKNQLLDDDALTDSKSQHQTIKAELEVLEKQIVQTQKQVDLLLEVNKLKTQIEGFQQKKKDLDERQEAFEKNEGRLIAQHEALMPHFRQLSEWQASSNEQTRLKNELDSVNEAIESTASELATIKTRVADLVGDAYNEEAIAESVEKFGTKMRGLINERDELRNDFRAIHAGLNGLNPYGAGIDSDDLEKSIAHYRQVLVAAQERLDKLKTELAKGLVEKPGESLKSLEDKIELLKEAIPLEKMSTEQKERLDKLAEEQSELSSTLEKLPADIDELTTKKADKAATVENLSLKLENEKLKAELETHRHHLEDGEPCPLCGALAHPYATQKILDKSDLEKELNAAQQALKTFELNWANKTAALKQAETQKKKLAAEFATEQEKLKEYTERLNAILLNFNQQEQDAGLPALQEKLKNEHNTLQQFINEQEKLTVLSGAEADVQQLLMAFNSAIDKEQTIKALYKGEDLEKNLREVRDALQENTQKQKLQARQLAGLKTAQESADRIVSSLQKAIMQPLNSLGYETLAEAIAAKLDESRFSALLNERNALGQELKLNALELGTLQKTIAEKKEQVGTEELESLKSTLETLAVQKRDKTETYNHIDRQLKNHADNEAEVERLQEEIVKQEKSGKKWVLLNEYIGDATGKKFNDFAQDLTLGQLVALANRRLISLNERYLLDKSKAGEDDGLMIIDAHMGNERRSVKTLSGGETFILSLSLALALSDLASRNVEIKSLFIDEGFGTLDPETLDQTLDTLEKLQSEGSKTIGIISHVEALKERINTKIELVRSGQGYSRLKVG